MTGSMNVHILLGRVKTDPELRSTQSGMQKLSFRMETERPNHDGRIFKDTHNVVAWGHKAEKVGSVLQIGDVVQVTGRVGTRGYDGRNGEKKWITETTAAELTPFGAEARAPEQQSFQAEPPLKAAYKVDEEEEIPF